MSFSRTAAGLCIYYLFVWSNLNFLLISQWITLPTTKGVFHITQSSSITGTSPSDCLVSYPARAEGLVNMTTKHGWVGKVTHWEMCKKSKFNHTNKWYIHNPAPVLENNTHKLLWDFDIHTDHLISARRPDLIIINKKQRICKIVDFAVPVDHRVKPK